MRVLPAEAGRSTRGTARTDRGARRSLLRRPARVGAGRDWRLLLRPTERWSWREPWSVTHREPSRGTRDRRLLTVASLKEMLPRFRETSGQATDTSAGRSDRPKLVFRKLILDGDDAFRCPVRLRVRARVCGDPAVKDSVTPRMPLQYKSPNWAYGVQSPYPRFPRWRASRAASRGGGGNCTCLFHPCGNATPSRRPGINGQANYKPLPAYTPPHQPLPPWGIGYDWHPSFWRRRDSRVGDRRDFDGCPSRPQ